MSHASDQLTPEHAGYGTCPASRLFELVDAVALRTSSWVVIERWGSVVAHGVGSAIAPPALADALLTKQTRVLRAAVQWDKTPSILRGRLQGERVTALEVQPGCTAWFVGGGVEAAAVPLIEAALCAEGFSASDDVLQALLHPRGPQRKSRAAKGTLLVLRSQASPLGAARAAALALAGAGARIHLDGDDVAISLPSSIDPAECVDRVRSRRPDVHAGLAQVPADAPDWVDAAALARSAERAARRLQIPLGDPAIPPVAAAMLVDEAADAVRQLAHKLPTALLQSLDSYDRRTSSELLRTLTIWTQCSFDVALAAKALHIHHNTLRYRLHRASQISLLDLNAPQQRLALRLYLPLEAEDSMERRSGSCDLR